ncbi:hypothetical protein N0V85_005511 [Neurospora sp. IMI 360204]|nr:hypothetical protein N0V85_005511 [Neurospora sp. IMI 360204]
MDTPQLYEDAKEFPHQLLTPGLTTRSTDTPNSFHWLVSPGADAYSTAPSTPALSLGGGSSPRHSLLISPIHVRHPELKDNTSSDFEPESEPEEPEVETEATAVCTSVAVETEDLEPPEDEVRSIVFAPQNYTTQPEQVADGSDEEAIKPESHDASATAISVEDTTAAPSDLYKPEPIISGETLASENRELGTEPAPLSIETAPEESDFPNPDVRPPQPSHETTVSVDARDANSETKSAPNNAAETKVAPVVQNENKVVAPETDYFKDFESLAESKPTADVIGSDINATEANGPVSPVNNPVDDLNGLVAGSGPEEDKTEHHDDQEIDTQVSDVEDVTTSSTEAVAHDVQPTVNQFQSGPEEKTAEPDNHEADAVTSETRLEPPSTDEVSQDLNGNVSEDEDVRTPSADETSPIAELTAQKPEQVQSSPEVEAPEAGQDNIKLPTEDLKQDGSADFLSDLSKPSVMDHTISEALGEPAGARENMVQTDTSSEESVSEHDKESSELAEDDSISPAEPETLVEDQEEEDMINTLASLHISNIDKATGAPWTTSAVGPASELLESNSQHLDGSALVAHVEIPDLETREPSGLESKDVENVFGPVSLPVVSKEEVHFDHDTSEIPDEIPNNLKQTDLEFEEKDRPHSPVDSNSFQPSKALDPKSEALDVSEGPDVAADSPDIQENDRNHIAPDAPLPLEEAPDAQQVQKQEVTLPEVDRADEPGAVAAIEQTSDAEEDYELSFGTVETAADIDAVEAVDDVQHVEHVEDVGTTFAAPDSQEDEKLEVSATDPDVAAQNVSNFEERDQPFVSTSDVVERGPAFDKVYDDWDVDVEEKPHFNERDTEYRDPTFPQFWPDSSSIFIPFAPQEALDNDTELFHLDDMSTKDIPILGIETVEYRGPTLPQFRLNDVLETAARSYAVSEAAEEDFEAFEPTEAVSGRVEEKASYRDPTMPKFRPHELLQPTPIPLVSHDEMTENSNASQQAEEEISHRGEDETEYRDPTMPQFRPNSSGFVQRPSVYTVMAETDGYGEPPTSLIDETSVEKSSEDDLDYRDPTMPQFRPNSFGVVRRPSVSVVLAEANGYEESWASLIDEIPVETLKPGEDDLDYFDPTMPHFRPDSDSESMPVPSVSDDSVDEQGEQYDVPAEDDSGESSSQGDQSAEYRDPTMPQFKPNWDCPESPHLSQTGTEQPTQNNIELTNVGPMETEKGEDATAEAHAENTESPEQLDESTQPEHVATEAPDTERVRDMQVESLESDHARVEVPEAKFVEVEPPEHIQPDAAPATESAVDTHSVTQDKEAEVEPSESANVDFRPLFQPAFEQFQENQEEELSQEQYDILFEPVDLRSATEDGKIETGATELAESDSESASEPASESTSERILTTGEEELYQDQYDALFEPREEHNLQVASDDAALKFPEVSKIGQVEYRDPTMPQFRPNVFLPYRDPTMPQFRPNAVRIIPPISVPERVQEPIEELNPDYIVERTMDVLDQLESEERAGLDEEVIEHAIDLCEQVLEQFGSEAEQTEDLLEQLETEQTERAKELLEEAITEHALEETDNALEKIEAEAEKTEELLKELDTEQTERTLEIAQDLEIQHSLEENEKTLEQLDNEAERTEELLAQVDAEVEELLDQLKTEKEIVQNEASLEEIDAGAEKNETLLEELDVKQHERAEEILEQQGSQQDVNPTAADESTEEPINPPVAEQAIDIPESFLDEFPEDKEQTAPSAILPAEAAVAEAAAEVPLAPHELVSEPFTLGHAETGTTEMQDAPQQPTVAVVDEATVSEPSVIQNGQLEHPGIELANLEDEGLEDADVESDVPEVEPTNGPVIVNCDTWVEHTDLGDIVLETPTSIVQRVAEETSSHEPILQQVHPEFPHIEHANLEDEGLEDSELQADVTAPAVESTTGPVIVNCDTWVEHTDLGDIVLETPTSIVQRVAEETSSHEPILQQVHPEFPNIEHANLEDEGLEDSELQADVTAAEPAAEPVMINCGTCIEHTNVEDAGVQVQVPILQQVHLEFPNIEHANLEEEGLEDSELQADVTAAEPAAEPVVINCDTWIEHADVEDAGVQVQVPGVVSSGGETTVGSIVIPVQSSHEEIPAEKSDTPLAELTPMSECVAKPDLENLAATESQSEQETSTNEPKIDSDINEDEPLASQVSHEQDADLEEQDTLSEVADRSLGDAPGTEDTDDSTGDVDTSNTDGSLRVEPLDNLIRSAEAVEKKLRELPEAEPATGEDEKAQGEEVTPALEPVEELLPPAPEAITEETGDFDKIPLAIPTAKQEDLIAEQELLQNIPAAALPEAAALPDLCLLEEIAPHQPMSAPAISLVIVTKEPSEPAQQLSDIPNPRQAIGISPRGSVDTIRGSDVDEEEAPELYAPPPTAGFFGFHHYHENKWAKVGLLEVLINSTSRRFSLPLQSLLRREHRSDARE